MQLWLKYLLRKLQLLTTGNLKKKGCLVLGKLLPAMDFFGLATGANLGIYSCPTRSSIFGDLLEA